MTSIPSRSTRLSRLALAVALVLPVAVRAQAGSYHVVKKIATAGEGGWDYLVVEPTTHRLFVSRGTHVQVVDLDHDSLVADIANTPGVHGIAFAPKLGRGFTSNGRDSSVTIFDIKTLAILGNVKVTGRNPDAIHFDEVSNRVFTFNGGSANATAIDAATGKVVGTVTLSGKPETAASDGNGTVYVNIETKNEIVAFDARTLAVKRHLPLTGCDEPTGMAIDRTRGHLYVGCGGSKGMAVVDYRAGKQIAMVPVGEGVDANGFDPATGLSFASAGEGTLAVVHETAAGKFAATMVPTVRGARTMALDERTHRIYLSSAQYGPMPEKTAERPNPRPAMVPGSFAILVLDR